MQRVKSTAKTVADKVDKAPTTMKVAGVAAAAAFMSSSGSQIVSSVGGALGTGATMAITQQALNKTGGSGRSPDSPAPESAPSSGGHTTVNVETKTETTVQPVRQQAPARPADGTKTVNVTHTETVRQPAQGPEEPEPSSHDGGLNLTVTRRRKRQPGKKRPEGKAKALDGAKRPKSKPKDLDDFLT